MKFVADFCRTSGILLSKTSYMDLVRKLMAAQNLSLDGQEDIFEKFLSNKSVNDLLNRIAKDSNFRQELYNKRFKNGAGSYFHNDRGTFGGPYTNGERMKNWANSELRKNPNALAEANEIRREGKTKTSHIKEGTMLRLVEALDRIQGKNPTITSADKEITYTPEDNVKIK